MIKKENSVWINGLKFFACVCVFLDHFDALFFYSIRDAINFSSFYVFLHSCCNFLLNVNYYLCIFYMISGILAQNKPVDSFRKLVSALILRYIRFVIPLFFASLFTYLISIFPGYYCQQAAEFFDNSYMNIFNNSNMSFKNVLRCAFLFDSSINPILWTIGCIFNGTCIIYIINYLTHKIEKKYKLIVFSVITLGLFIVSRGTNVNLYAITCTVSGSVVYLLWNLLKERKPSNKSATLICLFSILILNSLYGKITSFLMKYVDIAYGNSYYMILAVDFVIAFIFVFFINYSDTVKKCFSIDSLKEISKTSFSLYMVHEPIICSLGLYLLVSWISDSNYYVVIPAIFIITVIVLTVSTYIYYKTMDRITDYLYSKAKVLFSKFA